MCHLVNRKIVQNQFLLCNHPIFYLGPSTTTLVPSIVTSTNVSKTHTMVMCQKDGITEPKKLFYLNTEVLESEPASYKRLLRILVGVKPRLKSKRL